MLDVPIVLVSANPESAGYQRVLKTCTEVTFCRSGANALQHLESTPAHVVLIEAVCEDMSGIEVAEAIRDVDTDVAHYTYIILVGDETDEELNLAMTNTIDAHVPAGRSRELLRYLTAGARQAHQMNSLKRLNNMLIRTNAELQKGQLLDPLTGLGNRRMAEQSLNDAIRQIESRGGAVCFLMIAVDNYLEVQTRYDERISNDLVVSIANKIQQLVRPMDIVAYLGQGHFALVLLQPTIEHCTAECYQRIYDGVRLKSYKTAAGFLPANIAMSICASHAENGPPNPEVLIETAQTNLGTAALRDEVIVHHLTPKE